MAGGMSLLRGGMPLLVAVPELKELGSLAIAGIACRPGSAARGIIEEMVVDAKRAVLRSREGMVRTTKLQAL